jgi:diadenosine tetraphosphate (Ap4A) HIT family hydrolase
MIYNGKLCSMFSDHTNKSLVVVIPKQNCANITDMYPVDIAYLFNEVKMFCEHYRIRNYTIRVHRRDWEYSPHTHLQITMPKAAYESLAKAIGFQSETGKQATAPTLQPRASSDPMPPCPSPCCDTTRETETDTASADA